MVCVTYRECGSVTKVTVSTKGDNYRKRYPLAQITNAAYKRLLARVDRQVIKLDNLKTRIEDLEDILGAFNIRHLRDVEILDVFEQK